MPVAGRPASTLRGLVEFQWRRGKAVLAVDEAPDDGRATASLAGADPRGLQRR